MVLNFSAPIATSGATAGAPLSTPLGAALGSGALPRFQRGVPALDQGIDGPTENVGLGSGLVGTYQPGRGSAYDRSRGIYLPGDPALGTPGEQGIRQTQDQLNLQILARQNFELGANAPADFYESLGLGDTAPYVKVARAWSTPGTRFGQGGGQSREAKSGTYAVPDHAISGGSEYFYIPLNAVTGADRRKYRFSDSDYQTVQAPAVWGAGTAPSPYTGSNPNDTPASWEVGYEESGGGASWDDDFVPGYEHGGLVSGNEPAVPVATGAPVAPTRQGPDGGAEVLADEELLVQGTIMALDQESQMSMEDRKMIIQEFIETFGEDRLRSLMEAIEAEEDQRLGGGGVGPTDTVPAMLTPGEFVLPTDTMQQISNGKQIGREDLEQIQASAGRPAMGLGGVA